jgi:hypothetical protein
MFELTKQITKAVIGMSVTAVVANVLRNNTSPATSKWNLIQLAVGSVMIGALVAHASDKYIDDTFEQIRNTWNDSKKPIDK